MNVTFCFFGLNRSLSKTLNSIDRCLFQPVREAGLTYDIYGSFMVPSGPFSNPRSGEHLCHPERETEHLLGAKKVELIDQDAFDFSYDIKPALNAPDPWGDGYGSVRNVCRALKSLETVTGLWERDGVDHSQTLFIYVRPDLIYHDRLPVASLRAAFERYGEELFLTPYWATHRGRNDRFACLGRKAALAYGNRLHRVNEFLAAQKGGLHAETFVRYISEQSADRRTQPALLMRASRLRSNGTLVPESFANYSGLSLPLRWTMAALYAEKRELWGGPLNQWYGGAKRRITPLQRYPRAARKIVTLQCYDFLNRLCLGRTASPVRETASANARISEIARDAWSGSSINVVANIRQALFTDRGHQYAAYYNSRARVVLAKRKLGEKTWVCRSKGFRGNVNDAHNSVCLAVDGSGFVHFCWDHHNGPLNYAVSNSPGSLDLGRRKMTGSRESAVTYPQFFRMTNGDLLFLYRDGGSGNGVLALNRFSNSSRTWRQIQSNLIDGETLRSPYWGATVDANDTIHLSWIWRESPDVSSNHDLAYARSTDGGETWCRSDGTPYALPINERTAEYIVRIPQGSNLMNSPMVAADDAGRPYIVTYWSTSPDVSPRFQIAHRGDTGWRISAGPETLGNFSLSGGGTLRPPISRAIVSPFSKEGRRFVALVYRDDCREERIIGAIADLDEGRWHETLLTQTPMGGWEPSIDPVATQQNGAVEMLVQNVVQLNGQDQGSGLSWPHAIGVLHWDPANEITQTRSEG